MKCYRCRAKIKNIPRVLCPDCVSFSGETDMYPDGTDLIFYVKFRGGGSLKVSGTLPEAAFYAEEYAAEHNDIVQQIFRRF